MDTTLHDLDTSLAPATPQKWTSKAILRVGDQRIGQGERRGEHRHRRLIQI